MIGKVIASLLTNSTSLTTLIPSTRMYPYALNEDTPLPAIIYTIDSISTDYDKDGWVGDEYVFSVSSYSDDYKQLQNVVQQVRLALELKSGTIEGIDINRIYLQSMIEGYNFVENVYLNRLTFNVFVNNK